MLDLGTGDFSVSVWFRASNALTTNSATGARLVQKRGTGAFGDTPGWFFNVFKNGSNVAISSNGGIDDGSTSANFTNAITLGPIDTWIHGVIVFDRSSNSVVYASGIVVDTAGRTDLEGLYAIGEASCTGLHGANRMASNSLLECIVYAESAAKDIASKLSQLPQPSAAPAWDESQVTDSDEDVVISHNWDELRRFMWDYVGIVRTNKRLERALHRVTLLQSEIAEYYGNYKVGNDLLELRNLAMVAELMIRCAIERRESRGLHYTLDYPEQLPEAADTVLTPLNTPLQS